MIKRQIFLLLFSHFLMLSTLAQETINGNLTVSGNISVSNYIKLGHSIRSANRAELHLHAIGENSVSEIFFGSDNRIDANARWVISDRGKTEGLLTFYEGPALNSSYTPRLVLKKGGNVGIGTSSPTAKLHVSNGNNSYGSILAEADVNNFSLYTKTIGTWPVQSETFRLGLKYDTNEDNGFISFYRGGSSVGGFLGFSTYGEERMRILANGNIGIGTSTTGSHKLAVEGTIGAREVKVESGAWSDFVFKEGYQLKDLKEVETYIQENQHLPDIPSEAEVLANGIELGKMDAKLLRKIEELTLYTIQQQKEIEILNDKNNQLEEQLEKFESLENQLKTLQDQIQKLNTEH